MSTATVGTAIEKAAVMPGAFIAEYRDSFATVLPAHIDVDHWVRVSQGALRRNPKLADAARKNPASLLSALLDCARLGLEVGDTYHLVPYGTEVTGIRDYTGEIELAFRSGMVSKITSAVVHADDIFEYDESRDERPRHKRPGSATGADFFAVDRGPIVGVYAFAVFKDGTTSHVVIMDKGELDRHQAVSKSPANWSKWPEPYYRKTAIHELRKWVPTSAEFRHQMMETTSAAEKVIAEVRPNMPSVELGESDDHIDLDSEVIEAEVVEDGDPGPAGDFG